MGLRTKLLPALFIAVIVAAGGCTGVLGDFSSAQIDADGGTLPTGDSGGDVNTPPPPPPDDGGSDAPVDIDSGFDAGVDSAIPLGPPGKPGQSLTGGGTLAKSTNYKVWVAVGESPGGQITSTSTSYKLQSGVIGATQ